MKYEVGKIYRNKTFGDIWKVVNMPDPLTMQFVYVPHNSTASGSSKIMTQRNEIGNPDNLEIMENFQYDYGMPCEDCQVFCKQQCQVKNEN